MKFEDNSVYSFSIWIRPKRHGDLFWRFWFSNSVDSTFADGEVAYANRSGSRVTIMSASIADGGDTIGGELKNIREITYEAKKSKLVEPEECFWSDEIRFSIEQGNYMVFTWCICASVGEYVLPCTPDSQMPCFMSKGENIDFIETKECPIPNLIAIRDNYVKRLAFIGDSLRRDVEQHRIGMGFGSQKLRTDWMITMQSGIWDSDMAGQVLRRKKELGFTKQNKMMKLQYVLGLTI